jgi:hypothetical protein
MSKMSKKLPDEPIEGWPNCMICRDSGIIGGVARMEFRFCLCPAGAAKRVGEPDAVRSANETRGKLELSP